MQFPSRLVVVACAVLTAPLMSLGAQQPPSAAVPAGPPETLRGRVTSDSGKVVVGATVFITRGPDRLVQQAVTNDSGRYAITFNPGTGDYLVAVQATGLRGARRRVTRSGDEREFTVDFVLASEVATLDAVKIKASPPVRASTGVNATTQETGSSERWREGVGSAISPGMAGDINTTVSTIPGMTTGPGGPTMLGASSSSNLTTLNGMAVGAGSVPRAARVETRVTGATYDATRGGFSGANIDLRLAPGSRDFQNRSVFFTGDAPALQATDAIGRALGRTNTMWRASGGMDGELVRGALTYNVAVDASRSTRPLNNLASADPLAYALTGIALDSVQRARLIAERVGLPLQVSGPPSQIQRDALSVLARLDDTRDTTASRSLTMYLSDTRGDHEGTGVLTAPSAGSARDERAAGAMLQLGKWSGPGFSTYRATRFNVSHTTTGSDPYLDRSAVDVLVRTTADATALDAGVTSLALGGRGQGALDTRRWTGEANHEFLRNIDGRRHQLRAIAWGRIDGLDQDGGSNAFGRWSFASLADLEVGRPSSYGRTLVDPGRDGRAWNTAVAASHTWNPSRFVSLIYGARIEGNGFLDAPAANPALAQALGVHTGGASPRVHVSPRVGFTYYFNRGARNGSGSSFNGYGTWFRYPTGVLRGGIGEFRDLWRPDVVADARSRTGLSGSTLALTCVGGAVPIADWVSGALPAQCADGSGALAERAPAVTLLDKRWDAPRSWRANLDFNTTRWALMLRLSALATYDLNQASIVDRNFGGTTRFTLADEGNRPVFVTPGAVDTRSGFVSAAESRRDTDYGRVTQLRSDLRGRGGQLTVNFGMDRFNSRWNGWPFLQANYTIQRIDRQVRGFDGAAFGDPSQVEWAPGPTDARHVWILQAGRGGKLGNFSLFARLQSGLPFTPIVQGDVNGDGRGGDRAWVSAPAEVSDPRLASGLRAIETSGSRIARDCLATSMARPGARNACRGPWTRSMSASWQPPLNFGSSSWRNRIVMNVFADNILGGIDQLLHGDGNMRGWGGVVTPDPVLLVPRSFDPVNRRFGYDVNPRFAETRLSRSSWREPFRLTIDVNVRLHTDFDLQSLRRAIEPVKVAGKWERRGEDSLLTLYLRRTSSVHRALVFEADSLFLSEAQVAQLRQADSVFGAQVRDLYRPLARYLASQPDGVASKAALDSVKATTKAYWELFWKQPEIAGPIISPEQLAVFPMLKDMMNTPQPARKGSQYFFGSSVPLVHAPAQVRK
jgi:hypothetical protein